MKKKKSVIWFVVWATLLVVITTYSMVKEISLFLEQGITLTESTFADYQKGILMVLIPICLMPPLAVSLVYAIKEKNKILKVITICLLAQHILCMIAFAFSS